MMVNTKNYELEYMYSILLIQVKYLDIDRQPVKVSMTTLHPYRSCFGTPTINQVRYLLFLILM